MAGTAIDKFEMFCKNCQKESRPSEVLLYVDWEKKYYLLTCLVCNTVEAFDEHSEKIELKKDKSLIN